MNESDARALALVVFQKIHRDLPGMGEEPTERVLRNLILDAVNLLPDYSAAVDEDNPNKQNLIKVRKSSDAEGEELTMNVQSTMDSLRTVWREYQQQSETEKSN